MSDEITRSPFDNTESANSFGFPKLSAENTTVAVAAAGVATYQWDIVGDVLAWNAEAPSLLRRPAEALSSGRRYASLLDHDNLTSRYDAIMNTAGQDNGDGVAYQIEYQLKGNPDTGSEAIWVEDTGRWFGDKDGRPHMALGAVRIITARYRRDQELSAMSHTDLLTGMMNRNRLDEALAGTLNAATAGTTSSAFLVATIRNLDIVNESYGFEVADEVIRAMAQRLRDVLRVGDGIGRYSGSKFGVILNSCNETELPIALERFLNAARDSVIETSKGPVWAMLSIGAVSLPTMAATCLEARARAEESLSAALRLASDSYVVHRPSQEIASDRAINARCATEIVECLRNNRFQLAFQPMVSATTGDVMCHEALLRMRDEAGELVTAAHLVPVAERLGLIRLVDRSVVQLAIDILHRHQDARLSVNISATTANDPRWNAQLIAMIEHAQSVAERLTLEITETTALTDLSSALVFLERLRAVGCCVAIDDFGAGFTSFRNLRDLPIDVIKLDGSYCRNLTSDSENVHFARTLIDMAHHFGIRTVAEWVETQEDAEVLTSLGIDFLQGNFIGLPSIVPPWTVSEASSFSFDEHSEALSPPSIDVPSVHPSESNSVEELIATVEIEAMASDEPLEFAADDIVAPEETIAIDIAPTAFATESDAVFSGMEDGLAKLREALALLNNSSTEAFSEERLAG